MIGDRLVIGQGNWIFPALLKFKPFIIANLQFCIMEHLVSKSLVAELMTPNFPTAKFWRRQNILPKHRRRIFWALNFLGAKYRRQNSCAEVSGRQSRGYWYHGPCHCYRLQKGEGGAEEEVVGHAAAAEEDEEGRRRRRAEEVRVRPAGCHREATAVGRDGETRRQGCVDRGAWQVLFFRRTVETCGGKTTLLSTSIKLECLSICLDQSLKQLNKILKPY